MVNPPNAVVDAEPLRTESLGDVYVKPCTESGIGSDFGLISDRLGDKILRKECWDHQSQIFCADVAQKFNAQRNVHYCLILTPEGVYVPRRVRFRLLHSRAVFALRACKNFAHLKSKSLCVFGHEKIRSFAIWAEVPGFV